MVRRAGAQEAGCQGWLVRTGKFRDEQLSESGVVPDRVLASVGEVIEGEGLRIEGCEG